jgi:hypothetical protein
MPGRATAVALLATLVWLSVAAAELPPRGPEALRAESTHVVTAEVRAVHASERAQPERPGFVDTLYTLELAVLAVEKGAGPRAGGVVRVRAWRAKARPAGWAGPGGQSVIPTVGERVRAFLRAEREGELELLIPNGLERLPSSR